MTMPDEFTISRRGLLKAGAASASVPAMVAAPAATPTHASKGPGPSTVTLSVNGKTHRQAFEKRDQFAPELVYFSDCILSDTSPEPSAEEGIRDIRVVEAILRSIRTGGAVELAPLPRREMAPSLVQGIWKPPLEKPETVKAPGPSVR